jgi:Asp-tRNA(Asn)/Glu-tRNA(Gln) amidotransferase A subunit family amidase
MDDLHFKSACELASMIRRRELKASELMRATIERIEELNPKLNAFCATRFNEAMDEARETDEAIGRGKSPGPFAGLPLGVKDLTNVAGMKTTFGSIPFREHVAEADSVEVARLKRAGAIVVGKTNTPEFGHTAFTKNRLFGITRNPWTLERTPGGSSGGSSAAMASGMTPLATASDWGGSIRIPAAFTGAFGIKTTQGLIPMDQMLGMAQWVDLAVVGPITRTVRDASIYLDAVVGYHASDASSLPRPGYLFEQTLEDLPRKLRIGFHPDFGHAVEPEVRRLTADAASVFRQLGHEFSVIDEPVIETAQAWRTISGGHSLASLGAYIDEHREQFGRSFVAAVDSAQKLTWRDYGDAYRVRDAFNRWLGRVFERFDLLLTPTLSITAFRAGGPPPSEIDGQRIADMLHALVFTYPFNLSGHPAASVRAGITKEGLPCGLQIIAERHRDDLVMQAAYAYEQAQPWNDQWPRN